MPCRAVTDAAAAGAPASTAAPALALDAAIPFRGEHQAGIVTPAQDRLYFVALDVVTSDRERPAPAPQGLDRARRAHDGGAEAAPGGLVGGGRTAPPEDTGEALGLPASGLTITVGYGRRVRRPASGSRQAARRLKELPAFSGDELDPRTRRRPLHRSVRDDPQVAVHAVRNLVRIAFGVVAVRCSQLGFGRTSSTSSAQVTPATCSASRTARTTSRPRTRRPSPGRLGATEDGPGRLVDGRRSYLSRAASACTSRSGTASRCRIRRTSSAATRGGRASARRRSSTARLHAEGPDGEPVIASTRTSASRTRPAGGIALRRGYNFTDGSDGARPPRRRSFFLAYMRDPEKQFVPMQRALAKADLLNEYIEHIGSAVFACPPGVEDGALGRGALRLS